MLGGSVVLGSAVAMRSVKSKWSGMLLLCGSKGRERKAARRTGGGSQRSSGTAQRTSLRCLITGLFSRAHSNRERHLILSPSPRAGHLSKLRASTASTCCPFLRLKCQCNTQAFLVDLWAGLTLVQAWQWKWKIHSQREQWARGAREALTLLCMITPRSNSSFSLSSRPIPFRETSA